MSKNSFFWVCRLQRLFILSATMLVANYVAVAQSTPAEQSVPPSDAQNADQSASSSEQPADSTKSGNPPSLLTPLKPQTQEAPYTPITPRQRLRWAITNTIGPPHLVGGLFTSAFGTALDRPAEYGPHWGGFSDRFGMRLTGIVTGNAMEASLGYVIHEDPRYFRVQDQPFQARIKNIVRLTFMARRYDGSYGPAYARYVAISGSNFLSNDWRVQSEANTHDALLRTAEGFAGRMAANAFEEFWPDFKHRVFHSASR